MHAHIPYIHVYKDNPESDFFISPLHTHCLPFPLPLCADLYGTDKWALWNQLLPVRFSQTETLAGELAKFFNITASLKTALCIWLSLCLWQPPPFLLPLALWMLTTLEYSFHPTFWYPICTFINNVIISFFLNVLNWKLPSVSCWDPG